MYVPYLLVFVGVSEYWIVVDSSSKSCSSIAVALLSLIFYRHLHFVVVVSLSLLDSSTLVLWFSVYQNAVWSTGNSR
ncbi:hypothetical protein K7X08_004411 [Anisodus acutangulus]|uniref:Uncharacterized protein n=1 Tax=Anisodus acutangulus TaxID=402998 RepID=A0A9Q1RHE9_9SOLA|nr:hypothetical protein K7X08_004411 [Anisodus acutangulus]